jgi:hypothetical protein
MAKSVELDNCECLFFKALPPELRALNRTYRLQAKEQLSAPIEPDKTDISEVRGSMCGSCIYESHKASLDVVEQLLTIYLPKIT